MRFIVFLLLLFFPLASISAYSSLKVNLLGLSSDEKQILLTNLSIKNAEKEKNLSDNRILNLHQLAEEEITTTLQALGFYQSKIKSTLFATEQGWIAEYYIQKGPPILIRTVTLKLLGSGQDEPILKTMVEHSPLLTNKPLNHRVYETFKQAWLGKALQLGYLDAVFNINEIRLNVSEQWADITLELHTGNRYHFGEIIFVDPPYPSSYLKRYIPFSLGTPYTTEQLLTFQKNLTGTDLFTKVRIDPSFNETKLYEIPLKVRLTRKPLNKYTASTGFGSDTGLRGMLGYERRLMTFPGHRFYTSVRVSKRLNQGNLQYSIPGNHPATDRLVFGYQISEEKLSDKKYSLLEEIGATHIQKREQLEQILAFQYRHEKFRILQNQPKQKTHFLLPSIGFVWSDIDRKELLPKGIYTSLMVRAGLGLLLSSTTLMQAEGRFKWAIPLGENTRLILRTDLGATAISNMNYFPLSLRFFAGGDNTVRGYGYQSLGPTGVDQFGNVIVIGGRYLFVGSSEIERKIYKNISAALFFDSGNAFNKWGPRLANGAGVGIRWNTPLGPIRLDIAKALQKHIKRKPRIHLTFGIDL
jgi:translocation and assembly module TamA